MRLPAPPLASFFTYCARAKISCNAFSCGGKSFFPFPKPAAMPVLRVHIKSFERTDHRHIPVSKDIQLNLEIRRKLSVRALRKGVLRVARDALRPAECICGENDGAAESNVVLQRVLHARHLSNATQTAQLPAELRALRESCE